MIFFLLSFSDLSHHHVCDAVIIRLFPRVDISYWQGGNTLSFLIYSLSFLLSTLISHSATTKVCHNCKLQAPQHFINSDIRERGCIKNNRFDTAPFIVSGIDSYYLPDNFSFKAASSSMSPSVVFSTGPVTIADSSSFLPPRFADDFFSLTSFLAPFCSSSKTRL